MIRDCVYNRFENILDTTRHLLERDIMLNYRLYEEDTDDYGVAGGGTVGGGTRDAANEDGSDVEELEDDVIDDLIRDLDEDRIINDNIWRLNINMGENNTNFELDNILENRDFIINDSYSIINNIPIENVD